jgi:hypothetical protein
MRNNKRVVNTYKLLNKKIMTKKKNILVGSFTAVVAAGAIAASVTNASFDGDEARRNAVERALNSRDADAFHDATQGSTWADNIDTEKEFDAIVLAYDLRQNKKYKQAREVLERAGIEHPGRVGVHGPRVDVRDAVEHGDWHEFQQVSKDKYIGKIINTPEKFSQFVEANELHKAGRHNEARDIIQQLGLKGRHI